VEVVGLARDGALLAVDPFNATLAGMPLQVGEGAVAMFLGRHTKRAVNSF
jgi:hypothetical protein